LNGDAQITYITLSNSGTSAITLTSAQKAYDSRALSEITNTSTADILWQNASTGFDLGDGRHQLDRRRARDPNPGPAWKAIGTGDFTGDGFSDDILVRNKNTGQISVWEKGRGPSLIGGGLVSANPGTSWHAIGTGTGGSDILLQNTSGQTSIWEMSGNTITDGGFVSPNPG
jgi:FG-GAP repeat